jgi:hypothetical protein
MALVMTSDLDWKSVAIIRLILIAGRCTTAITCKPTHFTGWTQAGIHDQPGIITVVASWTETEALPLALQEREII